MKFEYKDRYIRIGLNIKYYRNLQGFTQEQLAERADINTNHLGNIETGRVGISVDTAFAIADTLDIPVYKLFQFRD